MNLVETARSLTELIEHEAALPEGSASISAKIVDAFAESHLFWMLTPKTAGGLETDLVTASEVLEEIAAADGSTGWTLMANSVSTAMAAVWCPDDGLEMMFGGDRPAIVAAMVAPLGHATTCDRGFMVEGRWQFGSGSAHATWLGGGARVVSDGSEVVALVPSSSARLEGNWDVVGLERTGSFDYSFPEQFVPTGLTFARLGPPPLRGGPVYTLGLSVIAATGHVSVALGIARRALREIARIASAKNRPGQTVLADQERFRHGFAVNDAKLRSVRAYLHEILTESERLAHGGLDTADDAVDEMYHRLRQITTYATTVASEVVAFAYTESGSAGLRKPTILGQCLRDVFGATQHIYVAQSHLVAAGERLLRSTGNRS